MKNAIKAIHKEAYFSSKSLKIPYEIKSDLTKHCGFLKSFKCSLCEGEMLEFKSYSFACNSCDNIEILEASKPYYDFNFAILIQCLKENLNSMKEEIESFKEIQIENEKAGETLAFHNDFKTDFCFFKNNNELKNFEKEERNYIIFTPFEKMHNQNNLFFIDIYQFLSLDNSGKLEVDKSMFISAICNYLYKILTRMSDEIESKSVNFFKKHALEFYSFKLINSSNLTKYKGIGGVEIFKSEVLKELHYAGKHDVQNAWNKIIKPKLQSL